MPTILVIDDNPMNRETFQDALESDGHQVVVAATGEEGLAKLGAAAVDAVLCDLKLPGLDGLGTMELAHERHGALPWIVVTGHGNEQTAVEAIKQGAFNYLTKPVDLPRLKATVASAVRMARASSENRQLRRDLGYEDVLERIVGTSTAVRNLKAVIRQVAGTGASVLIEGESGTGKELVADAIHALSERSTRPYVKINTAAIPRELIESELFGHERGAFTGAVTQKKGRFEQADGGTLFLDEIGEMPLESQVKLLRVLQDGSFNRVGGTQALKSDVRLVCATNRNLKTEVLAGRFRMDLYYRLNVVGVQMPALRERREDIPLLVRSFIERLNRKHRQDKSCADEVVQALRRREWPGNIRELENAVERIFVLSAGKVIGPESLELAGTVSPASMPAQALGIDPPAGAPDAEAAIRALIGLPLEEVEKRFVLATLAACNGNKTRAAKQLAIGNKTLYRKLEAWG